MLREMFDGNGRENVRWNVQILMQDYKSAVMICATLVNTQTHRETALTGYTISSVG